MPSHSCVASPKRLHRYLRLDAVHRGEPVDSREDRRWRRMPSWLATISTSSSVSGGRNITGNYNPKLATQTLGCLMTYRGSPNAISRTPGGRDCRTADAAGSQLPLMTHAAVTDTAAAMRKITKFLNNTTTRATIQLPIAYNSLRRVLYLFLFPPQSISTFSTATNRQHNPG